MTTTWLYWLLAGIASGFGLAHWLDPRLERRRERRLEVFGMPYDKPATTKDERRER